MVFDRQSRNWHLDGLLYVKVGIFQKLFSGTFDHMFDKLQPSSQCDTSKTTYSVYVELLTIGPENTRHEHSSYSYVCI